MTERSRRFDPRAVVLAVCAMLFCALAQLVLLARPFFGPSRGELPWQGAIAITVVSVALLVMAARKDGILLKSRLFLWGLAALAWLAFFVMVGFTLESPWKLAHVAVWLGGSTNINFLRPGVWRPLHVLHALGPIALVLAVSACEQPRARRLLVILFGVVPWLLGSALYGYLLTLPRPVYLG
jgi:hypothetical protein